MNDIEIGTALKEFNPIDAAIAELEKYGSLTISGIDDKEGYIKVHAARMEVKKIRVDVEKKRKLLKSDAVKFGQAVDSRAKELTLKLRPIEHDLTEKEQSIDEEKQRIKAEKERQEQEQLQKRVDMLAEFGSHTDISVLKLLSANEFTKILGEAKLEFEAKQAEKEKLEREKQAEADRLEAQRLAQEKVEMSQRLEREALLAEAQKLATEKQAIEDAKQKVIDDKNRAKELEAAKKEAVKQAKLAEVEKAKKKAAAEARKEALRPDKEKLFKLSDELDAFVWFDLKSDEANKILSMAFNVMEKLSISIREEAEKL